MITTILFCLIGSTNCDLITTKNFCAANPDYCTELLLEAPETLLPPQREAFCCDDKFNLAMSLYLDRGQWATD